MKQIIRTCSLILGLCASANDDLLASCPGALEIPMALSTSCVKELDAYFMGRAISQYTVLKYQTAFKRERIHWPSLNRRTMYFEYTKNDKVPMWRDIFDGQIDERNQLVINTFKDKTCTDLEDDGPIRPELADRCNARDLLKYASYIDACTTGISRYDILNQPSGLGGSILETNRERLKDYYLQAVWIVDKCQHMPITPYIKNSYSIPKTDTILDVIDALKKWHDLALRIAAMTGDEWAIYMYVPLDVGIKSEYMISLAELDPILSHRMLASKLTFGDLSTREQQYHAAEAHRLEREVESN